MDSFRKRGRTCLRFESQPGAENFLSGGGEGEKGMKVTFLKRSLVGKDFCKVGLSCQVQDGFYQNGPVPSYSHSHSFARHGKSEKERERIEIFS